MVRPYNIQPIAAMPGVALLPRFWEKPALSKGEMWWILGLKPALPSG